jgi:hydrogenase maturation protease
MTKILIIGIGNPLRGDDGLGWHAVNRLVQRFSLPDIEMFAVQQLTMDLVEAIRQVDLVLFIDSKLDQTPGIFTAQNIEPDSCLQSSPSHFFDPGTLLAAVQALYCKHPQAMLLTISANQFEFSESLSKPVQAALPELVSYVEKLCRS